ncbi:MAG TPA: hypothetical protein VHU40_20545 [Polyangia bacterium]|nr:hypothetical protein [Polyangia bacterium]
MGLCIVFGQTPARAEDAEEFVKRGIELRREAKDAEAFAEFKKAWAIQKTSRIEAQMALAEQALGLWVDAEEHLLEALAHSERDPWTQKNRAALTGALTIIQGHISTLDVWGTPAGAAVFVNEKPIGTLPLKHPLRISDDAVMVRVRAEGFLEWTRTVRLDLGRLVRQHVELIPAPAAAIPAAAPVAATSAPSPTEAQTVPRVSGPPEQSPANATGASLPSSAGLRPYAWAAGAGAVLGLGLGVVESLAANNKRNQFNDLPECGTSMLTPTCQTIKSGHDRAVTLATVGYVSGGGLAVLSTVFFILSSSRSETPTTRVARSCVGDFALRGVACVFPF